MFSIMQLMFTRSVSATTYNVGVRVGEWARYQFTLNWTSTPPQEDPSDVLEARKVTYTELNVTDISGLNVTALETIYFANQTETNHEFIGDIKTGTGNLSVQIIAKNLEAPNAIWEIQDSPSINRTSQSKYAGSTRMVNLLRLELMDESGGVRVTDFYWDKEFGFLCEMAIFDNALIDEYNVTSLSKWVIIETNLWQPGTPNSPTGNIPEWAGLVILAIVAAGIVFFVLRKPPKKRSRKRVTSRLSKSRMPQTKKEAFELRSFKV